MVIATKFRPRDDGTFFALTDKLDDGWKLDDAEDWEQARDELDMIIDDLQQAIDAAEDALQYADKMLSESKPNAPGKGVQETVGVGWECSGCGTGTFSRCLACDEAACGMCLISHECSLVEGTKHD